MAKRFCSTDIWDEDWFLEMPIGYKLFWSYMLASCNHAGLFKVNLGSFCRLNEVKIEAEQALQFFNNGKERIRVVNQSLWYIEDFFVFQYGPTLNLKNRVHNSVKNELEKNGIELTSIRGLIEVKDGVKDKDKDKDIVSDLRKVEDSSTLMPDFEKSSNGVVSYDAEKTILENQIEFERICMATRNEPEAAKKSLRKFHLHLTEKEQYPKGRKACFAGFEKWLLNDKDFNKQHGKNNQLFSNNTGQSSSRSDTKTDAIGQFGLGNKHRNSAGG